MWLVGLHENRQGSLHTGKLQLLHLHLHNEHRHFRRHALESFGLVFGSDDLPLQTLYKRIEMKFIDGMEVRMWTITDMGVAYTFWVSEYCVVEKAHIISS